MYLHIVKKTNYSGSCENRLILQTKTFYFNLTPFNQIVNFSQFGVLYLSVKSLFLTSFSYFSYKSDLIH